MLCITAINTSNTIRTQTGAAISVSFFRTSCFYVLQLGYYNPLTKPYLPTPKLTV